MKAADLGMENTRSVIVAELHFNFWCITYTGIFVLLR
jgi:hypothetical protein